MRCDDLKTLLQRHLFPIGTRNFRGTWGHENRKRSLEPFNGQILVPDRLHALGGQRTVGLMR